MEVRCLRVFFDDASRTKIRPDRERGFSHHLGVLTILLLYVLGRKFTIESDNKPLIPLLSSDLLPSCIVRLHLRLAEFNYIVNHVPGKLLHTADTLSHAPLPEVGDAELEEEVQAFVDSVTQSLPTTKKQ